MAIPRRVSGLPQSPSRKALAIRPLWRDELSTTTQYTKNDINACFKAVWSCYRFNFPNATIKILTSGNDTANGTSGSDLIASLNGADTVNALGGNDKIIGGSGVDTFDGGEGDDPNHCHSQPIVVVGDVRLSRIRMINVKIYLFRSPALTGLLAKRGKKHLF